MMSKEKFNEACDQAQKYLRKTSKFTDMVIVIITAIKKFINED